MLILTAKAQVIFRNHNPHQNCLIFQHSKKPAKYQSDSQTAESHLISQNFSQNLFLSTCQRKNCKKLPTQLPQWIRTYPLSRPIFYQSAVGCERRSFSTNVATRGILTRLESSKIVFLLGSAPDPAGETYNARSHKPLVGWRGGYTIPIPHPGVLTLGTSNSTPSASRVRRLPYAPKKLLLAAYLLRLAPALSCMCILCWVRVCKILC